MVWPSGIAGIAASGGQVSGTIVSRTPFPDNSDDLIWKGIPTDGPGNWHWWLHEATNPGDPTRKNQTMHFGYNIAKGGGVYNGTDIGVGDFWESHWDDGGGFVRTERHIAFVTPASVQTRIMTAAMRTDTYYVDVGFNANEIYFNTIGSGATTQLIRLTGSTIATKGNIDKQTVGGFLRQYNGSAFRSVVYHDSTTDRTVVGDVAANGVTVNKDILLTEEAEPNAPAANCVILFAKDSGGGKTQLYAKFNTGNAQLLATEP